MPQTRLPRAKIRKMLYALRLTIIKWRGHHIQALSHHPGGHTMPCTVCSNWAQEELGVVRAIRIFGGRPR